jgi:uncharacterized SAM-binding protein YcdF (DUF218 family)
MNRRGVVSRSMIYILAILLVWTSIAPFLAERLIVEKPLDKADAILVLAGAPDYKERTRKAAFLYNKGITRAVLLTNDGIKAGWSRKEQRNPSYFELAERALIAHGVPENAIEILPSQVSGTITEARLLRTIAVERRWKSLLIVTSPYHTRRALRTFENVFAEKHVETSIGLVPAEAGPQTPSAFYWWLTWKGWRDVGGEYVKSTYYIFIY